MKTNPSRHLNKLAAAEDELAAADGEVEEPDVAEESAGGVSVGERLSATELFLIQSDQLMNAGFFKAAARDLLAMGVPELKRTGANLAERCEEFTFAYPARGEGTSSHFTSSTRGCSALRPPAENYLSLFERSGSGSEAKPT